jgi:uncharacterized protein YdiU (UPF0061 family)
LQLTTYGIFDEERKASRDSINPKFFLRNYLCQTAIDTAEQGITSGYVVLELNTQPIDEFLKGFPLYLALGMICGVKCAFFLAW